MGMRAATGITVGDHLTVELPALRADEVNIPDDLAKTLILRDRRLVQVDRFWAKDNPGQ